MKIMLDKYPLVELKNRQEVFNDPLFKDVLLTKKALSKYTEDQKYFKNYRQFLEDISTMPNFKAKFITSTVMNYLMDNATKLTKKMWPFLSELSDNTGMLLWNNWSFFYRKFNDGDSAIILYLIVIGEKRELGAFSKEKDSDDVKGNSLESDLAKVALTLSILVLPFLEFAECETKIINANINKHTKLNKEKYFTNINNNIEIVDSSWFTTIIKTEGFGVHGHFRLQPIGVNRSQRKMIWIKDFQKHGYIKRSHLEIKRELITT